MTEDYVWCDGKQEIATISFDYAIKLYEEANCGKVWKRIFSEGGLLEGVTDVTPKDGGTA